MSEPGCSARELRACWAGTCLAPQRCSQHSPWRGAGRGILPWQNPSGGGDDGSFPFVPPACRFPSSNTEAMVLAGRVGGVELPLPGEMQHLSGLPLHLFLPGVTSPACCCSSPGLAPGTTFLNPLPSGDPGPPAILGDACGAGRRSPSAD